jgi:uncharacterized protein YcfL
MKKVIFALAIAGMFGFAACSSNEENKENKEDVLTENKDQAQPETAAEETQTATMDAEQTPCEGETPEQTPEA